MNALIQYPVDKYVEVIQIVRLCDTRFADDPCVDPPSVLSTDDRYLQPVEKISEISPHTIEAPVRQQHFRGQIA